MVRVRFADKKLERLETELGYTAGFGSDIVKQFRKKMAFIRSANDERDFYAMKSLHYEKLQGKRSHQRSMKLNDQFRLILEIEQSNGKAVVILSISKHYE
jgi:proteic killer suppression protein